MLTGILWTIIVVLSVLYFYGIIGTRNAHADERVKEPTNQIRINSTTIIKLEVEFDDNVFTKGSDIIDIDGYDGELMVKVIIGF